MVAACSSAHRREILPRVSECPFCACVAAGAGFIHARPAAVAFPDTFPVSEGHVLVVPRHHLMRVENLERGEWAEVFGLVRRYAGSSS